ncbi:mucin-binding protein [Parvimonas micra]|uniref:mucin-binding protein n=1 Tax=Parvimonas micra TaxID=33033 RepID=UPI0006939781|nr:LPXTG cell wall anchor domain-containing protein [Parvimonas micra]
MNSRKSKFPIGNKNFISVVMASFLILGTIVGGQTTYADTKEKNSSENLTSAENVNAKEEKSEKSKLDSAVESKENKSTKEISKDLLKASKNVALNQAPTQISNFTATIKTADGKVLIAGSTEQLVGQGIKLEEVRMRFTITQDGTLKNGTELRIPLEAINAKYGTGFYANLSSGTTEPVAGIGTIKLDTRPDNLAYVLTISQEFVDSVPNGTQKTVEIVQRSSGYGEVSAKSSFKDLILTINGEKFTFTPVRRQFKKIENNFTVGSSAFTLTANSITIATEVNDPNYYNNMLESDGQNPGETGIPDGDIISIHHIKANPGSKIIDVKIENNKRYTSSLPISEDGRYLVKGDTITGRTIETDPNHKTITLPENATKEDIFKALKQSGKNTSVLIKKGNDEYVFAVNLGKMKGPEATTYHDFWPSDDYATKGDEIQEIDRTEEVNKRVDKILKDTVAIHGTGLATRIVFADSSINNSISTDSHSYSYSVNDQGVGTEISNNALKAQTTPSNAKSTGQQKITVHHLDTEGNELVTQDYAYGYPAGSPIAPASPNFNAAVKTIPGYKLLTTAPTNPITTVNGTQLTTAKSIPFANDDQVFYYVYTANTQKVTYTVIDETEQKTLEDKKPLVSGPSNSKLPNDTQAKYQDIIDGYMDKYELVDSDVLPAKFDSNDNVDQNVVIRLRHKTTSVVETKNVTQTIKYVYQDNSEAAPTKVTTVTFTRNNSKDLVTGQIVSNGNWAPLTESFAEVVSPNIAGFTPDKAKIEAVNNITADSTNINETVVYTENPKQKVLYTVIDDTEQKTLRDKEELVVGESDSNLPASATADYDNVVEFYKSKGYELVSQEPLPNKFDTDDSVDQVVTIHLKHGSESKVETKKVSLTINYSGAGDKTPASHVEEATWTRTVTTDKVTGAITDNGTWVADKTKYAKVTSPVIDGYTADVLVVEEETVTQDNIIKEVKYTAKPVVPNKPGEKPSKPETPQNPQPNPTKPAKNLPKTGIANASLASAIAAFGALSTVMVFRRKKNNK